MQSGQADFEFVPGVGVAVDELIITTFTVGVGDGVRVGVLALSDDRVGVGVAEGENVLSAVLCVNRSGAKSTVSFFSSVSSPKYST